jgi:hypothetical protein
MVTTGFLDGLNFFLELQRRNDVGEDDTRINRIPLLVTELTIATNKTVPNMGIPFSGAVRGESTNLAFDMGLAQKTISITGVLLEQNIKKKRKGDDDFIDVVLTSFELAQLIHSYVDSSSFQDDQNINKILFFYPSRVDNTFSYRKDDSSVDYSPTNYNDYSQLPKIPFNWKNRSYDNTNTFFSGNTESSPSNVFDAIDKGANHIGLTGFIRSFSTSISGAEFPAINFTMEFEEAVVISDNFFD